MIKIKIMVCYCFVCALLICPITQASSIDKQRLLSTDEQWQLTIAPYSFIFGMSGYAVLRGNKLKIKTTPLDVIENLSDIDFIGELHLEASKGRWTYLFDPTYLKQTKNAVFGTLPGSIEPEMGFIDMGVLYTQKQWNSQKGMLQKFQWLVGARAFMMKMTLNPGEANSFSAKQDFLTPMVGARWISQVSPNLQVITRVDLGGFGIDHVNNTWSAVALANYSYNDYIALVAGFRVLGIDYDIGALPSRFALNARLWGPVLGLKFTIE